LELSCEQSACGINTHTIIGACAVKLFVPDECSAHHYFRRTSYDTHISISHWSEHAQLNFAIAAIWSARVRRKRLYSCGHHTL